MGQGGPGEQPVDQGNPDQQPEKTVGGEEGQVKVHRIDQNGEPRSVKIQPGYTAPLERKQEKGGGNCGDKVENHSQGMAGLDGGLGTESRATHAAFTVVPPEGPLFFLAPNPYCLNRATPGAYPASVTACIGEKELGQKESAHRQVGQGEPGEGNSKEQFVEVVCSPPVSIPRPQPVKETLDLFLLPVDYIPVTFP